MSAYVVDKSDIDDMIAAGLTRVERHDGPMRWADPMVAQPEDAWASGQPWGPGAVGWWDVAGRELTPETADRVGAMLWSENAVSVSFRYGGEDYDTIPGPDGFSALELAGYTYDRFTTVDTPAGPMVGPRKVDPVRVLHLIGRYEYQSCEHPGWHTSEAKAFVEVLYRRCVNMLPEVRAFSFYPEPA